MIKYIENVKKYFAAIKQRLDTYANNPMNAKSLQSITSANRAICAVEQNILKNPYGIIWVDIFNNWDLIKVLDMRAISHLQELFIWAYKKSPVQNIRDARDLDTMFRIGIHMFIAPEIDPNTLTLIPKKVIKPIVLKTSAPVIIVDQNTKRR